MSLLIIFNNKNAKPWKEYLQEKLPEVNIEVYPNVADASKITFALCWKPEEHILSKFPNLKVVQSAGASVEHITSTQNITKEMSISRIVDPKLSEDMFEYILMGILAHLKDFNAYHINRSQKIWEQKSYKVISNTNVCVLGLGQIGTHVAEKLQTLGFKVSGWSKSKKKIEDVLCFHKENGLNQALSSSDILINLLPLTEETENILNLTNLCQLNKGAYLINVGRGEHLVESDLLQLLETEHLSGALLDVFRNEPLDSNHPFWQHEKIFITPHVAALTNVKSASNIVIENYRNCDNEEKLINLVSIQKGY